jgi:hypothetical protein
MFKTPSGLGFSPADHGNSILLAVFSVTIWNLILHDDPVQTAGGSAVLQFDDNG